MSSQKFLNLYQLHPSQISLRSLSLLLDGMTKKEMRSVLLFSNEELMKQIDDYIWIFSQDKFITHTTYHDPYPTLQEAYLTTISRQDPLPVSDINPNKAQNLFIIDNKMLEPDRAAANDSDIEIVENAVKKYQGEFERFVIFDLNAERLQKIKTSLESKFQVQYFTQNLKGVWEKTA